MSSLIELMHTVLYDRVHDIPQCNISIDVTLLYVLKYNIFYCSLQILNDWSVVKKLILLPKKESRKTLRLQRNKTSLTGSIHLLYQQVYESKLNGRSTFAGNDAEKLHLQTKVCFFHFKIVSSLLRGCFFVPGSLYQLALDLRTKTSTNTRSNSKV